MGWINKHLEQVNDSDRRYLEELRARMKRQKSGKHYEETKYTAEQVEQAITRRARSIAANQRTKR